MKMKKKFYSEIAKYCDLICFSVVLLEYESQQRASRYDFDREFENIMVYEQQLKQTLKQLKKQIDNGNKNNKISKR